MPFVSILESEQNALKNAVEAPGGWWHVRTVIEDGSQAECQCWDCGIRKEKVQKLNVMIERDESNEMISVLNFG